MDRLNSSYKDLIKTTLLRRRYFSERVKRRGLPQHVTPDDDSDEVSDNEFDAFLGLSAQNLAWYSSF